MPRNNLWPRTGFCPGSSVSPRPWCRPQTLVQAPGFGGSLWFGGSPGLLVRGERAFTTPSSMEMRNIMNHESARSCHTNDSGRCPHRTFTGRRCRLNAADHRSGLCGKHLLARDQHIEAADLTLSLTGELARFSDSYKVNEFLSRLLLLLAQGRISPPQAGVMAYISSLHLRTLDAIDRENDPNRKPVKIILGSPSAPTRLTRRTRMPGSMQNPRWSAIYAWRAAGSVRAGRPYMESGPEPPVSLMWLLKAGSAPTRHAAFPVAQPREG